MKSHPKAICTSLQVKIFAILLVIILSGTHSDAQTRNVIWYTPSKAATINGLAIGPFESNFFEKSQTINGITINGGLVGLFAPFVFANSPTDGCFKVRTGKKVIDSLTKAYKADTLRYIHNGLVLSGAGMLTDKVSGILISPWFGHTKEVNGLVINGVWNWNNKVTGVCIGADNECFEMKGIQIGLVNRAVKLKGVQIGLWNKNMKRGLPFINWNFKS